MSTQTPPMKFVELLGGPCDGAMPGVPDDPQASIALIESVRFVRVNEVDVGMVEIHGYQPTQEIGAAKLPVYRHTGRLGTRGLIDG